jgi:hypothetical protein
VCGGLHGRAPAGSGGGRVLSARPLRCMFGMSSAGNAWVLLNRNNKICDLCVVSLGVLVCRSHQNVTKHCQQTTIGFQRD